MPALIIDFNQTTSGIKQQFMEAYPYLKIEFFKKPPVPGLGNPKSAMIKEDLRLSAIQNKESFGTIGISDKLTVIELEDVFKKEYGLYVQVFRKSGKVWLETTATDSWTLEQQNEEGESLEAQLKN